MARIPIYNLGTQGVLSDPPAHTLPPEVWTNSGNMFCAKKQIRRTLGYVDALGTPTVAPSFIFFVPSLDSNIWLYTSLTKAYVYDDGTHTDITRTSGGDYTATTHRDWNGCLVGGIPILNNGADIPQYWSAISSGTPLANLPNWPSTLRAKVVRAFGGYLIALNITESSTNLPQAFRWSQRADPGAVPASWDYTSPATGAGRVELTDASGGQIVDGLILGNQFIIYKQNATHTMRFIGGQEIFQRDLLFQTGILAPRCVTGFNKGRMHLVVTEDDIIVHGGNSSAESIIQDKVRDTVFGELDSSNYLNSFVVEDPAYKKVLFCYPTQGQTIPDKALVWDYGDNTIDYRDIIGVSADIGSLVVDTDTVTWDGDSGTWDADTGVWNEEAGFLGRRRVLFASPSETKTWVLNSTYVFGSTVQTRSFVERTGLAIVGRDRQGQPKADYETRKLFKRIWPKITGLASVYVSLGSQEDLQDEVTWASSKLFIPDQKYLDFEVAGKFGAVRFESTDDAPWQLEGYDLELEVLGTL